MTDYRLSSRTCRRSAAQGGTSLRSGEIDVFLHRRLLGFDYPGGGMGPAPEPLNETRDFEWGNDVSNGWTRNGPGIVVRGKHQIGIAKKAARMYRRVQEQIFRTPVLGFYAAEPSQTAPFNTYNGSILRSDLPQNIHILSFQQTETSASIYLLRIMHKYAVGEDENLSKATTVSLASIFEKSPTFCNKILSMKEMNLIANQNLADKKTSLKWNGESGLAPPAPLRSPLPPHYLVELSPLKIRTFYVTFGKC